MKSKLETKRYIERNHDAITGILTNDSFIGLLALILHLLNELKLDEMQSVKFEKLGVSFYDFRQ